MTMMIRAMAAAIPTHILRLGTVMILLLGLGFDGSLCEVITHFAGRHFKVVQFAYPFVAEEVFAAAHLL